MKQKRKCKRACVSVFILFSVVLILSPILVQAAKARNSLQYKNSPFGFHPAIVIPPLEYGIRNPYDVATDIGVKWDRSATFIWMQLCPDPRQEKYLWERVERQLRDIPETINPVGTIHIGIEAMAQRPEYVNYAKKGSFVPLDEKAYTKFVKAVVERYDGDGINDMPGLRVPIKYWMVDNEPPHGLRDYAEFLKITYQTIKEADPDAKVIIGGVAGLGTPSSVSEYAKRFKSDYLPILDELARFKGHYFDIFDFHWYGNATGDYLMVRDIYKYIKQQLDERGLTPPGGFWITEMGTYSGNPIPVRQLPDIDPQFQTERQQAADLVKRYVYSIASGISKVFMAFGLKEGFKHDRGYFDFTGLIYDGEYENDRGKGVKKLSYYTYKKMTETLEGSDWKNIEIIREKNGIYIYKLLRNGKPIWVAWNDNKGRENIKVSGIKMQSIKVTPAVPDVVSGIDVRSYNSAFRIQNLEVRDGQVFLEIEDIPVFIEER